LLVPSRGASPERETTAELARRPRPTLVGHRSGTVGGLERTSDTPKCRSHGARPGRVDHPTCRFEVSRRASFYPALTISAPSGRDGRSAALA
jgi:hypothetical protein